MDNDTTVAMNEEIPSTLLKVKEKGDILEHVQNNLLVKNQVDKIIPVRNLIDEKFKENFQYSTKKRQ